MAGLLAGLVFLGVCTGEALGDLCYYGYTYYSYYYYYYYSSSIQSKYCDAGCCGYYYSRYCCATNYTGTIAGSIVGSITFIVCIVVVICIIKKCNRSKGVVVVQTPAQHPNVGVTLVTASIQPTSAPQQPYGGGYPHPGPPPPGTVPYPGPSMHNPPMYNASDPAYPPKY